MTALLLLGVGVGMPIGSIMLAHSLDPATGRRPLVGLAAMALIMTGWVSLLRIGAVGVWP